MPRVLRALILFLSAAIFVGGLSITASASTVTHDRTVTAVPSTRTPNIVDGRIFGLANVGNKIIVAGTFTRVTNPGSTTELTRNYILAFDATTGVVDPNFAPVVNGIVNQVISAGDGQSVYLGGTFTSAGGAAHRNVARLNLSNGAPTAGFKAVSLNGAVRDLALTGNRLIVAGSFTTANSVAVGQLITLNAATGARDSYLNITVTENHSWPRGAAKAVVGTADITLSPDGTRLAVLGNFRFADGLARDQIMVVLLQPGGAIVDPNWRTTRYEPLCYNNAYDSYVRDIEFAPDGSYFVAVATGGGVPGSLCDTASRWETNAQGQELQPTWIADAGGDTLHSVEVTGSVVYVGGHQRWLNNANGVDYPASGAVPRPGLAALDPLNGVPTSWNPGRNPRGIGAEALLATADGLYVGSDTDWFGNFQYKRAKIGFFPLAGAPPAISQDTGSLPANVYAAGRDAPLAAGDPIYRVNAGGGQVAAIDGGMPWAADDSGSSPYRNGGSNSAGWAPVPTVDGTVPTTTPSAIFDSERWDPGDPPEMAWAFDVAAGTDISVRLYFANRCDCTQSPGSRVFDVSLDGTVVLNDLDLSGSLGHNVGTMRAFDITSDGSVNIDFAHYIENPLINGIEIVAVDPETPEQPIDVNDVARRYFTGTGVLDETVLTETGIEWSKVRGAFMAGNRLVYGYTDGNLYTRTFSGTSFGPAVLVDPYNDPYWSDVSVGDSAVTFRGTVSNFYSQLPNLTGMYYSNGQLFYTLSGQSSLFYRGFSLDSLIVEGVQHTVPGSSGWNTTAAMFASGNDLYVATRNDSTLSRVSLVGGVPTGARTAVSGPAIDGIDWKSKTLFIAPGPVPNQAPTASFTANCAGLTCSFDASASTDPNGPIDSYAWTYGDATTGTGVTSSHTYAEGSYTVTLTVTDSGGKTASATQTVNPVPLPNQPPVSAFTASCVSLTCSFDAGGSSDSDGSISTYAWSYGDTTSGSGRTSSHAYTAAGAFEVTLTVTDNEGLSTSSTQTVNPTEPPSSAIAFRASAGSNAVTRNAQVVVPAAVQAGDGLILVLSVNSQTAPIGSPAGVTGFTRVGTPQVAGSMITTVWQKVAAAGDAGATVSVDIGPAYLKASLSVLAYSGTAASGPVASASQSADPGTSTAHNSPTATAANGAYVLTAWADKSSTTTTFTEPAGTVLRDRTIGTVAGHVSSLIVDSGAGVAPGQVGGLTATTNAASRGTAFTLVLAPAAPVSPPTNQQPTASFTADCTDLACSFDAAASGDADGTIATYAWEFGDGELGSGVNTSYTYGAAGSFTVTLTVTDNQSATGTASQTVTVTAPPVEPPVGGIDFRASASSNAVAQTATVTVPPAVQSGDGLILVLSVNLNTAPIGQPTGVAGFVAVGSPQVSASLITTVWQKVAGAGDAGTAVSVSVGTAWLKTSLTVLAYSGTSAAGPIASMTTSGDPSATAAHPTPAGTAAAGAYVLSVWTDKSSTTEAFTEPAGVVVRDRNCGTLAGHVCALVADSGAAVAAGPVGGLTATTNAASRGTALTIVLAVA